MGRLNLSRFAKRLHVALPASTRANKRTPPRAVARKRPQERPSAALATVANPSSALDVHEARERLDEHPAAVYLARLAPGSRASMKSSLGILARLLGGSVLDVPWHELKYQHTLALRSKLEARYQPASANKHLSALRGVLLEAKRLGKMTAEDYAQATDLKPVRGERIEKGRALSDEEIHALFSCLDPEDLTDARDLAILAVLYGAGLRRSEATGLCLGDLDFDERSMRVRGKGNKERLVYFDEGTSAALQNWLEFRDEDAKGEEPLLLPVDAWNHAYVRRLSDQAVLRRLQRLSDRAQVKSFSPHDMRRTFITRLLDRGVDIRTAQRLAGHSQVTTTQKYDRRGEEAKKRAVDVLAVPFKKRAQED